MIRLSAAFLILAAVMAAQDPSADARRLPQLLAIGSQALASGRLEEVDRVLAEAVPLGPDIGIEILRAELMMARKQAAAAAATMADAIRKLKPEAHLARAANRAHARALVDLGNHREAAPVILASLGLDAAAAPLLAIAARGFGESGDRRTARGLLSVAIHLDPRRIDLLKARAGLALEDGDPHDALRDAETLIARAPADAEARVLRAHALHALGRAMEARDALAALDRVRPLDPALLRVLAGLDLEAGLMHDAEAVFRRLGALESSDAALLARAWLDRRDAHEAIRVIESRSGGDGDPELVRLLAAAHLDLLEAAPARDLLRTLNAPTVADQIALARAEALTGDGPTAAKILESILARDAGDLSARVELISVRILQGDLAAARRLLDEGLVLSPHHPPFARALEDLVPELASGERATAVAVLHAGSLTVDGTKIAAAPLDGFRQLRGMRLGFGTQTPTIRLVLSGSLDATAVQRAFDLLGAAGFSRIAVEAR